jgi:hypothetical protein
MNGLRRLVAGRALAGMAQKAEGKASAEPAVFVAAQQQWNRRVLPSPSPTRDGVTCFRAVSYLGDPGRRVLLRHAIPMRIVALTVAVAVAVAVAGTCRLRLENGLGSETARIS